MKDDLRDLMDRLNQPTDAKFSCFDWMEQSGYTKEQRLTMLRFSSELSSAALDYIKKHPVSEWSANDWKRYELSQWDCTEQMRTSLPREQFTPEQADAIAEAYEHERYVCHTIQDGYGRMHHCPLCPKRLSDAALSGAVWGFRMLRMTEKQRTAALSKLEARYDKLSAQASQLVHKMAKQPQQRARAAIRQKLKPIDAARSALYKQMDHLWNG
jgi:hypothetical protein